MTKRPRTPTAAFVRTVNGQITKTWRQRVRIDKPLTSIGLGPYPEVTLAEAAERTIRRRRR